MVSSKDHACFDSVIRAQSKIDDFMLGQRLSDKPIVHDDFRFFFSAAAMGSACLHNPRGRRGMAPRGSTSLTDSTMPVNTRRAPR